MFRCSRKVPGVFAEENHDCCEAAVRFLAEDGGRTPCCREKRQRKLAFVGDLPPYYRQCFAEIVWQCMPRMFTTPLRQHCGYWRSHATACALIGLDVPTMSWETIPRCIALESLSARLSRHKCVSLAPEDFHHFGYFWTHHTIP